METPTVVRPGQLRSTRGALRDRLWGQRAEQVPHGCPWLVALTDDIVGFSGDFGSGVGWEDEEEKETEEAGEEAEEEEGEAGDADDGGYIW